MAFRVILIENEVEIKAKLNNLIVTKEGEDIWIPLDDISMIVMDNLSSMLSARLLCQLSEQGIGLMFMINDELEKIFQMLNEEINQLGNIELIYTMSDVWDMVQKSSVTGNNETLLEDKGNYELLVIFLNLIEQVMNANPKKVLVIIENIDHLISRKEYMDILEKLQNIGMRYDIYFILSTSMDGYARCDKALCSGISIWGNIDFQMPEFDKLIMYIQENYPYNKKLSEKQLQDDLVKIIHRIGQKDFLCSVEENVVCKLINQSMMLYEKWKDVENAAEIAFLKA